MTSIHTRPRNLAQARVLGQTARRRVLVVGPVDPDGWSLDDADSLIVYSSFVHLTPALLDRFHPDMIIAPLITDRWDALDLAEFLVRQNYKGQLLLQSLPLPRADLVLDEIRGLYPELPLSLTELVC